jgi:SAM-dependent methyltransferase
MKDFWNERYSSEEYIYGTEPNLFSKAQLDLLEPGTILLPADGEGRNGVYAATLGWEVTCFDISEEGKKKATQLADSREVKINYLVGPLEEHSFQPASFDVIALTFAHFPPSIRQSYHREFVKLLKPGGHIILQGYSRDQTEFQRQNPTSGGPRDPEMLFSIEMLRNDFVGLTFKILEKSIVHLEEGDHHVGEASVINMNAIRP